MEIKEQKLLWMKPLFESGAMSRNQYPQLNQIQETSAEVSTLEEERSRVIGQILLSSIRLIDE